MLGRHDRNLSRSMDISESANIAVVRRMYDSKGDRSIPRSARPRTQQLSSVPGQEKRVAWVELFFDLVFVVAVTQVSSLLHADHSW
jgi:Bacterial low temperature requirement A protein (LtrA)